MSFSLAGKGKLVRFCLTTILITEIKQDSIRASANVKLNDHCHFGLLVFMLINFPKPMFTCTAKVGKFHLLSVIYENIHIMLWPVNFGGKNRKIIADSVLSNWSTTCFNSRLSMGRSRSKIYSWQLTAASQNSIHSSTLSCNKSLPNKIWINGDIIKWGWNKVKDIFRWT